MSGYLEPTGVSKSDFGGGPLLLGVHGEVNLAHMTRQEIFLLSSNSSYRGGQFRVTRVYITKGRNCTSGGFGSGCRMTWGGLGLVFSNGHELQRGKQTRVLPLPYTLLCLPFSFCLCS